MLDKLPKAFGIMRKEIEALKETVDRLEKVRPISVEGKPGKDRYAIGYSYATTN